MSPIFLEVIFSSNTLDFPVAQMSSSLKLAKAKKVQLTFPFTVSHYIGLQIPLQIFS